MLFVIPIQCYADQLYVKKYIIFLIYIKNKSTWKIKKKINLKLIQLSQLTKLIKLSQLTKLVKLVKLSQLTKLVKLSQLS